MEAKVVSKITVDLFAENTYLTMSSKQGDTKSRYVQATITANGNPAPIPQGLAIFINYLRADGESRSYAAERITEDGAVEFVFPAWALEIARRLKCDISTFDSAGAKLSTAVFYVQVEPACSFAQSVSEEEDEPFVLQLIQIAARAEERAAEAISVAEAYEAAISSKIPLEQKGSPGGVATLDYSGHISDGQEADPTVPPWAKSPHKPEYAFDEVVDRPDSLSGYGIQDAYTKEEIDTSKLSKTSLPERLYGTDKNGNHMYYEVTAVPSEQSVVLRDGSGAITVPDTPGREGDATSKKYVDQNLALKLSVSQGNAPNGYAELDQEGKISSQVLPSFVDDIVEYPSREDFPAQGQKNLIYYSAETSISYRWTGSDYIDVPKNYVLPPASVDRLGGVKVGRGLNIDSDGFLNANFARKQFAKNFSITDFEINNHGKGVLKINRDEHGCGYGARIALFQRNSGGVYESIVWESKTYSNGDIYFLVDETFAGRLIIEENDDGN